MPETTASLTSVKKYSPLVIPQKPESGMGGATLENLLHNQAVPMLPNIMNLT